jgi:transcriptional regulator with XRE-family HTH domain
MPRRIAGLAPSANDLLRPLGERLRLARLRRRLTAKEVAGRAGMAPMTLRSLERGSGAVTIGAYAAVMQVLGIGADLDLVAQADPVGRSLQDSRMPRFRAMRRQPRRKVSAGDARAAKTATAPLPVTTSQPSAQLPPTERSREEAPNLTDPPDPVRKPIADLQQWIDETDL